MKNKKRIIWGIVVLAVLLLGAVLVFGNWKNDKIYKAGKGSFSQTDLQLMNKRIRKVMHLDENNRDYYGGCYLEDGQLFILVTDKFKDAKPEVKEAMEQEDGVTVREVEYTYLELEELQDEIGDKWMELEETGSESTKEFLKDFNSLGMYVDENRVYVGIKDLTLWKQIQFRTIFHLWGDGRILFESNSGVWLD